MRAAAVFRPEKEKSQSLRPSRARGRVKRVASPVLAAASIAWAARTWPAPAETLRIRSFCLVCLGGTRREDIAPNLDYELERVARETGRSALLLNDARQRFLKFASSASASWRANFRDLSAAVTRMATLAPAGRIRVVEVEEEIERLEASWREPDAHSAHDERLVAALGAKAAAALDLFDRAQLATVLEVCAKSASLSEAGRSLFAESRKQRTSVNDADRLRKYLARFGLDFAELRSSHPLLGMSETRRRT